MRNPSRNTRRFCKDYYAIGHVDPHEYFYNYTNHQVHECIDVFDVDLHPGNLLN